MSSKACTIINTLFPVIHSAPLYRQFLFHIYYTRIAILLNQYVHTSAASMQVKSFISLFPKSCMLSRYSNNRGLLSKI